MVPSFLSSLYPLLSPCVADSFSHSSSFTKVRLLSWPWQGGTIASRLGIFELFSLPLPLSLALSVYHLSPPSLLFSSSILTNQTCHPSCFLFVIFFSFRPFLTLVKLINFTCVTHWSIHLILILSPSSLKPLLCFSFHHSPDLLSLLVFH